jgi:lysophospholipase L1-like esterase
MVKSALLLATVRFAIVIGHDNGFPINPALGVPGFPDCVRARPSLALNVEDAANDLICAQKEAPKDAIKIGCIGDSITAGVHSSGGNHTYPGQLQILLDQIHGEGKYSVTNLGACGSTMLKKSNSPYWKRSQYTALTKGKWDIITIMLGTNDAKDPGDHGPNNWLHDCGGPDNTKLDGCSFADDYKSMVDLVRTLGTTPAGPKIYAQIPPPLMQQYSIGANQTVINSVYPKLVSLIQKSNKVLGPIDVYSGMGGVTDWEAKFPKSCQIDTAKTWAPCAWWCDKQSCDQCHPNNAGYHQMATLVLKGLGLDKPSSGNIVV